MAHKLFAVAIATLTLTAACQSEYFDTPSEISQPSSSKVMSRSSNSYFPEGWQYLETNEERYAALQLPEDMLPTMSTEELVEACMSYPLALDCFAYNDVKRGVTDVISRFNGFAELKQRDDAFDKVLDFYSRKLDEISTLGGSVGYVFQPLLLSFYERFIISGYLLSTEELAKSEKLNELYYKAEIIRDSFEELQGHIASETLLSMKSTLGKSIISRFPLSYTTETIYTKGGLPVIVYKVNCGDRYTDITEGRIYIQESYPNVTIIEEATCTYNCHGYAWYVSEGGEKRWIDQTYEGNQNISNFWSDGTYKETTADYAQKVFYPEGDHSAVAETSTVYISKWGPYQLVRHNKTYCPYYPSKLRYFTKDFSAPDLIIDPPFKTGKVYWDMDPQITPENTYEDFSINDYYDSASYRVDIFISNPKEPEEPIGNSSQAYIMSKTNQTARVYFASRGIYYVCFFVYSKKSGNCIAKYTSDEVYVGY